MAYGTIKIDNITFDNGGSDQNVTVSGLYNSLTSGVTVTGTISGSVVIGGTSVSGTTVLGTTVTGTTVQGVSGTFTSLTGTTITGTTINGVTVAATTGSFTSLTGTTTSGTTANFASGVFTTQISGATVTGTTANFTSGNFTNISGGTHTITSGVFASGTVTNPSISFVGDSNTGIYASATDQVSITTNGTERLRVDAAGQIESVSLGTAAAPAFSFTTDPNTGIYSPGADQVAISTNGTGRVFVDSAGRFLLEATSTSVSCRTIIQGNSGANNIGIAKIASSTATPGSTETLGRLEFTDSGHSGAVLLAANRDGGTWTTSSSQPSRFTISTTPDAASTAVERLRISSAGTTTLTSAAATAPFIATIGSSEVARIDSSGRLGLGTSSPEHALDVRDGSFAANQNFGIQIGTPAGQWKAGFKIKSDGGGAARTAIDARADSAGGTVEAISITSAGNVGIGTQSPGTKLWVSESSSGATNGTNDIAVFDKNSEGYIKILSPNNAIGGLGFGDPDDNFRGALRYDHSSDAMSFFVNDSERARIDSSGRLLVGKSSGPGNATLQIQGDAALQTNAGTIRLRRGFNAGDFGANSVVLGKLEFGPSDEVVGASIEAYYDANTVGSTSDFPSRLVFFTTADGASSPTERLRISNAGQIAVAGAGTAAAPVITKNDDLNTGIFFPAADTIAFAEGGSEAARIDSSGRLLVGTSTARDKFFGGIPLKVQVEGADTTDCSLAIVRNDATADSSKLILAHAGGTSYQILSNNDAIGDISWQAADGNKFLQGAHIRAFVDGTPGVDDMPTRLEFSVTADGSASPTEALRITNDRYVRLASGSGGIQFNGDTAAANALDDYEEGTWTPTCFGSATAGTYTPSSVFAYYTKIGNQVTVIAQFGFSAATGGTGDVRFAGLPFNYKANAALTGACRGISVNTTSSSSNGLVVTNTVSASSAGIFPILTIDNAAYEAIPISGVTTSSSFGFTLTYTVS